MNYQALREAVALMVEEDLGCKDQKKADIVLCQLILRTPVMIMSLAEDQAQHIKKVAPLADVGLYTKDLLEFTPHGVLNQVLVSAHELIVDEHVVT